MSDSSLVAPGKRILSPNCNSPRNHKIDMVVIHCMAGNMTIEGCAACFAPVSRQASSNYGIGSDGRIGQYVLERDRSWCTCSPGIDNRAITIEVANIETVEPFRITEKAYESLLNLLVDICRRNNIPKLLWKADKNLALAAERGGSVAEQNMAVHRWFENKSCPGNYLYAIHGKIAEEVNRRLENKTPIPGLPQGVVVDTPAPTPTTSTTTPTTPTSSVTSDTTITIDYTKLKPYVITLDRNAPEVKYDKMIDAGVVGAVLEGGYLYSSQHQVVKFRNPNIRKQVEAVAKAGLKYGMYMIGRARNIAEVNAEMDEFSSLLRVTAPKLGVWIQLQLTTTSQQFNDKLITRYKERLYTLGFKGQIGFYTTETQLKKITWSKHQDDWALWIIDHVDSLDELDSLLDPEFFDMEGRYD